MRIRSALSVLVLALACSSPSKPPSQLPTTNPSDPVDPGVGVAPVAPDGEGPAPLWSQVRSGRLANGLTYYVMPHDKPEGRASAWLAVNAGSLQEDDDQQGLAHFVEHMAFNGTAKYPRQAIIDYLEKIGMEFGPDVNAYTSFDETVYQLQLPTDDPSYLATGLDILRQWAGAISFDPVEVDKERGVVLEEWRLGRGADERLFQKQAPIIFGGTRYAKRLPIGQADIIKGAPREAAQRFYRDWYRPDLMAVIVVGAVDVDATVAQIERGFGDLVNPAKPRPRNGGGSLDGGALRVTIDTDPELTRTTINLSALFPQRRESHASDLRGFIVDGLYHEMFGARMARLARKPDAPFVFMFSSTGSSTREHEAFSRFVFTKDGQASAALAAVLTEEARVAQHGFTEAEFARAKASYLKNSERSAAEWDKNDGREYASELTRHFFEHELVIGRVAEFELTRKYLPEITLAELNQIAGQWRRGATESIAIQAPADAKGVPTEAEVRAMVAAARTVEPWTEADVPTSLLAAAPTPGRIVAETPADDLGVIRWSLSNGAKVVIKPTTFDNQRVLIQAVSPGGTSRWSDARYRKAQLASQVVPELGAGQLDADQLEAYLAGKDVSVWPMLAETSEWLWAQGGNADLAALLELIHARMVAPRRDPEAFAAWRAGRVDLVARRDSDPDTAFNDAVFETLGGRHLRRRPLTAAVLAEQDLDESLAAWRDRFGDAGDFTFVVVGAVDPAALRPLVERYLASLPGSRRADGPKDVGVKPPRGVVRKLIQRGTEPKASVQITFHDDQRWSRDAERDLDVMSAVLDIRLREILREDMGGVYGVGVWGGISRLAPQRRSFTIRFGCSPDNAKALEAAALAEIERLKRDGVDASYLDKVRETRRRSHETDLTSNRYWVSLLAEAAQYGDDPHALMPTAADLDAITNDRVKAAAKRYLDGKRMVTGVLMPAK